MSWNNLSMKDKASYIRMGVENGITDLDTIREVYNKFAEGGSKDNTPVDYELSTTVNVTPQQQTDRLISLGNGVYKDKISGKLLYNYDEIPTAEVTGHKKEKSINDNWQAAYAKDIPSGTMASDMETMNAVTGGILNLTSPTQVLGATGRLIKNGDIGQFGRNLILGNNGIVSDAYAAEHPYLSMAANIVGDGVTLGLIGAGRTGIKNSSNYVKQGIKNTKSFIKDVSVNYKDYLNDINYLPQTIKAIKDGRYTPFMTRQQAKIALRKNQEALQKVFDDAYNFNKSIEANKSQPVNIDEQYKVNIDNWDKVYNSREGIEILNLKDSPYINSKPTLYVKPLKTKANQPFQNYSGYYVASDNSVYIPSRDRSLMLKHILIDPNSNSTKSLLAHELKHHIQEVVPQYRDIARYNFFTGENFINPDNTIANEVFDPIRKNSSYYETAWHGAPTEVQAEVAGLQYKFNNPNNYINQPWYNRLRMRNFVANRFFITPSEADKMLKGMSRHSFAMGGPIKKSYKDFSTRLSKAWNNENLSKHDYDYQKYYNDDPEEAYKQLESIEHGGKGHFPDGGKSGTYKTPNHPTYPDLGSNSWLNNDRIFNISARQAVPENTDRVLDYLGSDLNYNRGATRVMYDGAYQLPEVIVTPDGNYTELVPNELNTGWMYRDRAGRFDDVDYSYLDNYLGNKKSLGGNLYGNGGSKPRYRSSSNIRKQISTWEGSTMRTNVPFDRMDTMFNQVLPAGALDKLSQSQLDGLYSFAYNVGTGRFKTRTAPTLAKYLQGNATIEDVKSTMWASGDKKYRGLANRRKKERSMLGAYVPVQEAIPMTTPIATPIDITPAAQPIIESNPVIQDNIETLPLAFNTESQKESDYTPGFFNYVNYINKIRQPKQPKQRDRRIWLTI